MPTQAEEQQASEFLKRAEIRTMRKDLMALRESDALKERDKIVKLKTLEELRAEEQQKLQQQEAQKAVLEEAKLEEVLTKNEGVEREAEKDLKNYATEEERQQIFLLESQRLGFEKEIERIDKERDPELKLEKNRLLLQKRDQQAVLDSILEQEEKLQQEQKVIADKEQTSAVPAEKKTLEQSRWDWDKKIQEMEKKRWEAERKIQETDAQIQKTDQALEQLVISKNALKEKVLGADKSVRDIYSVVMAREEEKMKGDTEGQKLRRETLAQARLTEKEETQRQQWLGAVPKKYTSRTGVYREKLSQSSAVENEQRKKFMQNVEAMSSAPQNPGIPPVPQKKLIK